jgi:hypothetical protein
MAEDPLYPEFENFNKKIDEEKVYNYLNIPGNSFDKDLNKLLKKLQRQRDNSNDSADKANDSFNISPRQHGDLTITLDGVSLTTAELKARKHQLSNRNKEDIKPDYKKRKQVARSNNMRNALAGKRTTNNTAISVKNNKETYTNYIKDIPKGLGIDLMPGGSIVNTAYKG